MRPSVSGEDRCPSGWRAARARGGPRRGLRHLHCVMGPVRQLRRHRRCAGVGRPGRRGLGPAGLPCLRSARSRRGHRRRWSRGVGQLARPPRRWRRRHRSWAGQWGGGGGAGEGRGCSGGAGGRGRVGGGPRRPALPAAAILSSEEEEEEEEASAAGPAARPAWVSPGLVWWPWCRCLQGRFGLSLAAHVGQTRRLDPPGRGSGPPPPFPHLPVRPGSPAENAACPRRRLPLHACPETGPWGVSLAPFT